MPADTHLRPFEEKDAAALTRLLNNPAVYRYLSARLPIPYTEDEAQDFIARCRRGERHERAIIVNGETAGGIGCALPEADEAVYELSYWLGESFWRQGIMTRALQLFLAELRLLLPRGSVLRAKVFAPHVVSQRILLHAGFKQLPGFELKPMRDGLPHVTYVYDLPVGQAEASA